MIPPGKASCIERYPPAVKAVKKCRGSVAAVTSAIAAEASRQLSPSSPCTFAPMDPDTSSASITRLREGSTPAKAR